MDLIDINTNGKTNLRQSEFSPQPQVLFNRLVDEKIGGLSLAIIHGSYVYLGPDGPLNCTYREKRIYNDKIFSGSIFELVEQPPDVDILAVAPDPRVFKEAFIGYMGMYLRDVNLNHFIEMTIVKDEVLRTEINRPEPGAAMKRVFALKQLIGMGDLSLMEELQGIAKETIEPVAVEFQEQYNSIKTLYRINGAQKIPNFRISREDFVRDYPLILKFYDTENSMSPFPREREKITLPRPLKLRTWEHYENGNLLDTSLINNND